MEHDTILLAEATLDNSPEYAITGCHKVKILKIYKENTRYMMVALVLNGKRYSSSVWVSTNYLGELSVGQIVNATFIGFTDACENTYRINIS